MSDESDKVPEPLSAFEKEDGDRFFVMDGGEDPWGDYGHILVHGMSDHLGRRGGRDGDIQLERVGPFVPPITFPGVGNIVVTTPMKDTMESAGFLGISFKLVIKAHIAEVPWHTWDLDAEEPKFYPEGGEPENYILLENHSSKLADQLGELWEMVKENGVEMERIKTRKRMPFRYVPGSLKGYDLFSAKGNSYKYISPRAKRWFAEYFKRWTSFRKVN